MISIPTNTKLIIFDLGNVIVDINMQDTIEAFSRLGIRGIEKNVTQSHSVGGFFTQLEQGRISPSKFYDNIRNKTGINASDEDIRQAWNAMIGELPDERVNIIEKLREQYIVVILSNTNIIHLEYFDSLAKGYKSLSDLFHQTWYSHEMHLSKPSPEIYKKVLDYHKVNACETIFFDDSKINIEAAQQIGIQSYLVEKEKGGIMNYFK